MKNIALVSYNSICLGQQSGWQEQEDRRALVIQNYGAYWMVKEDSFIKSLSELDHIVVYVGARGLHDALKLASPLPPEKVTFVLCPCDLGEKYLSISRAGFRQSQQISCECGGLLTMNKLLTNFLETGQL